MAWKLGLAAIQSTLRDGRHNSVGRILCSLTRLKIHWLRVLILT